MAKLRRIDIVKSDEGWVAKEGGAVVSRGARKDDLVREVATAAKSRGEPASVRIHKADGKFQEERTYPRSADPSSRG